MESKLAQILDGEANERWMGGEWVCKRRVSGVPGGGGGGGGVWWRPPVSPHLGGEAGGEFERVVLFSVRGGIVLVRAHLVVVVVVVVLLVQLK